MKIINLLQCGDLKISRSLAHWAGEISEINDFTEIMEILHSIFQRELLDMSDEEGVHISDEDAYTLINKQLISTQMPVDDIALVLLNNIYFDLLNNFIELIIKRKVPSELSLMRILIFAKGGVLGALIRKNYLAKIQRAIDGNDTSGVDISGTKAKVEDIWE